MTLDQLFVLKADFIDQGEAWFCPGCAEVLGVLEYYPELKKRLRIHQVDYPRPRPDLVSLLGEEHQSCPVLVLGSLPPDDIPGVTIHQAKGHSFVDDPHGISAYFAHVHGIGRRHD